MALTLSTRNEGRKHQFFPYSHSICVVGLLCVPLVLLRFEAEKRTTEPPRSKAEVNHWKPAPVDSRRTLANVHFVVEDLWYAFRLKSLSYSPRTDSSCSRNSLLGPIIYFRLFYKKIIVLNSGKVALDILEGRSAIYSDRPMNWMAGEIAGRKRSIFFMSFSDPYFKISRRLLQTGLNTRACKSYRPIQMQETQTLLQNLANSPEDFAAHIRR